MHWRWIPTRFLFGLVVLPCEVGNTVVKKKSRRIQTFLWPTIDLNRLPWAQPKPDDWHWHLWTSSCRRYAHLRKMGRCRALRRMTSA